MKKAMAKMEAQLRIEMETRVEGQVEVQVQAQVQERIRVEIDVAGLQDQVGEIRSELDNADVSDSPRFTQSPGLMSK